MRTTMSFRPVAMGVFFSFILLLAGFDPCSSHGLPAATGRLLSPYSVSGDTLHPSWVRLYGSDACRSQDNAAAIALDRAGNTLVTGTSTASGTGGDFLTIKYDASGQELWVRRYNGTGGGADQGEAIAIDLSGNAFVAGRSWDGAQYDCVIIKYTPTGGVEWVTPFDGPADTSVIPTALRVDSAGAVYVGACLGMPGRASGLITLKLDPLGNIVWSANHRLSTTWGWGALAFAVDDSGNALIAGTDFSPGANDDWITVKFSPAGQEMWVARYSGAGVGSDVPRAMCVDSVGNVYVTGWTQTPDGRSDFSTIAYNAGGIQQWVRTYDGPSHEDDNGARIVLDGAGGIFVAGSSKGANGSDMVTIKYSTAGDSQWVARFDGAAHGEDIPSAIAVDGKLNIVVAGVSTGAGLNGDFAAVRYSPEGTQQWVAGTDFREGSDDYANSMALDSLGGIHLGGGTGGPGINRDLVVVAYDTTGEDVWTALFDGPGTSSDAPVALCMDGSGNIAATGTSVDSADVYSFLTVRYDPSGAVSWADRFAGGDAVDVAADAAGNIYMTGTAWDSTSSSDFLTVKYDSSGGRRWVARYNRLGSSLEHVKGLAVDSSGCVYVTGVSYSTSTGNDMYTVKYDSTGTQQWVTSYTGFGNRSDIPRAIVVDAQGNAYVTGTTWTDTPVSHSNYVTLKYSPAGQILWASLYNGPGNGLDSPWDVVVDRNGYVYVTGESYGSQANYDYATVKYNPWGDEVWVARYSHTGSSVDLSRAIVVGEGGESYVTGFSAGAFATVKYNAYGEQEWVARRGSSGGTRAFLAMDRSGSVYVSGTNAALQGESEFLTLAYDSSGVEQWTDLLRQPGSTQDSPVGIAVDRLRNVYVVGASQAGMFVAAKYEQGATAVQESSPVVTAYRLEQNYPNPCNPATTIEYALPTHARVSLRVYDILGREVRVLVDGEQPAGSHAVRFDAANLSSGVYFYRLQAGTFAASRKFLLLR
jgi:uncharacterized delta-60 repeat protein